MSGSVPMTRDAYNRFRAEIERLESVEMPRIAEKIAQARAEGDLKENAEYHAQRENQGLMQARINELRDKLARADIIDPATMPKGEVVFGATVVVKDLDYGDEEKFTLVGAGDEDYEKGKILVTSPIGQGLLGKRVGDTADIPVPSGVARFEIVSIGYE